MTLFELKRLTQLGEGLQLEFKRKVPQPERIVREVIALANTHGGKLLIGVDDDGSVVGVKDVEEELFVLHSAIESYCEPPLSLGLNRVPVTAKREVIVVDVPSSSKKPHFLVQGKNGTSRRTAFVRINDQAIEASQEVVELMYAEKSNEDIIFEYGAREHSLMTYLDRHERITVDQFATLVNEDAHLASKTLVLLTQAGILRIHPNEKEDYFTLSIGA
jgi:predicted HTH transcriptional regulator